MRTYSPKASEINRTWHVVDAEGLVLGRLATEVARILRGKHKPIFAPHSTPATTSSSSTPTRSCSPPARPSKKIVYRHSGYPGGLKPAAYADLLGRQARGGRAPHGPGHAPEEPPRPPDAHEAQGLRRPDPPARRPAARSRSSIAAARDATA